MNSDISKRNCENGRWI